MCFLFVTHLRPHLIFASVFGGWGRPRRRGEARGPARAESAKVVPGDHGKVQEERAKVVPGDRDKVQEESAKGQGDCARVPLAGRCRNQLAPEHVEGHGGRGAEASANSSIALHATTAQCLSAALSSSG